MIKAPGLKAVTSQESVIEGQEPSDSGVFGNDRLGSIWIAIQRIPDSAPPASWILAPGSYYRLLTYWLLITIPSASPIESAFFHRVDESDQQDHDEANHAAQYG